MRKRPHIVDVGEPEEPDGSPDLSGLPFPQKNSSGDGMSMNKWLTGSGERPPKAGAELTSLIPFGERRY